MKRFYEKKGNIDFDVYGYRVHVVFTTDLQKSADQYEEIIGHRPNVTGAGAVHTWKNDADPRSYLFFKWDSNEEQVAHEAWHAVRRMLKFIGATLDDNENVAYHIGHLVGCIHRFKAKFKRRK